MPSKETMFSKLFAGKKKKIIARGKVRHFG